MRTTSPSKRYPPLLAVVAAFALAMFALPSALNLPQANPGQTTEYAPVTGGNGSAGGNIAALGLGGGAYGPGGVRDASQLTGGGLAGGAGGRPSDKQCVGNPPRQTEDPMSPPCVAFFNGNNFGATYPGVTEREIRVVVYTDGNQGWYDNSWGVQADCSAPGQLLDAGSSLSAGDGWSLRDLKRFQVYFNRRYQTYGRQLHIYEYCSSTYNDTTNSTSSQLRQSEAADALARIHPFAVVTSLTRLGYEDSYSGYMAQHGVLDFSSAQGSRSATFFQTHPGLLWSVAPTTETIAKLYGSYLCREVVGKRVIDSNGFNGQPRKLGLLYTTDPAYPELTRFGELTEQAVKGCGGNVEVETFPAANHIQQSSGSDPSASYAVTNMATFQRDGITTILWAGGYETHQSKAAADLRYYPEWILGGLSGLDGDSEGALQDQTEWSHAWVMTPVVPQFPGQASPCAQALQEVDPSTSSGDIRYGCGLFTLYDDLRQLVTGVQRAGPRLTPATIDQGFHAIPRRLSGSPTVPACFYEVGDYTCIKDATREWWDTTSPPRGAGGAPGCWLLAGGGPRYIEGSWPDQNIGPPTSPSDPCNNYDFANQF